MRLTRFAARRSGYGLGLTVLFCLLSARAISAPPWPLDVRLQFRSGTLGMNIGSVGLQAADLDGDGAAEIVAAAYGGGFSTATFWYVLSHQGTTYRQRHVSTEHPEGIGSLAVGAVDGDVAPEIVVALGDRVHVLDGRTRDLQWVIPTTVPPPQWSYEQRVRSLQVGDVDSDGAPEIVFCARDGVHIHDAVTGAAEAQGLLDDCHTVQVGNVDGDPALELVVATVPGTGYVLDGVTRAVQWSYPLGFGWKLRLGDLDGDGIAEIVAAESWYQISVLDAVSRTEENALYVPGDIGAVAVADVEGDGANELLWAGYQSGDVHVLNGSTLVEKWQVPNPDDGPTNLLVADTDGDGVREVVFGAGSGHTGPDYLYVVDAATRQTDWKNVQFRGPFLGLAYGDVEGNGKPDFLYTSYESDGFGFGGRYFVYGANAHRLRYTSPSPNGGPRLARIQVANVDADPQLEVLVGAASTSTYSLTCYDGLTHAEQWRVAIDTGLSIWALQVGDLDGDGRLEVVAGTAKMDSGAPGQFVYVFDAATGAREWRSPSIPGPGALTLLRLAQVDGDAPLEILVAEFDGRLFMIDGVSHVLSMLVADRVTALETTPRRDGVRADVLVGTSDGQLFTMRPPRRWQEPIARQGGRIDGLAARDLNGDGVADYAFAVDGNVSIRDGRTGETLWQSGRIGTDVGNCDSLLIGDIDGDGLQELMVNTGHIGVDIYEVAAP